MVEELLKRARAGESLYICDLRAGFRELPDAGVRVVTAVLRLMGGGEREFTIRVPETPDAPTQELNDFLSDYFRAEVYNVLINLGGESMTFYLDTGDDRLVSFVQESIAAFDVEKPLAQRRGYGIAINVIDRMLRSLHSDANTRFAFHLASRAHMPPSVHPRSAAHAHMDIFRRVSQRLEGKTICGIDVGGSDIKAVLTIDGRLSGLKEYDWFPEKYATAEDILDPILLMVRLLRAWASLTAASGPAEEHRNALLTDYASVIHKDTGFDDIKRWVTLVEDNLGSRLIGIDAIGLCFPDVVVKDKVVGGEVTKTRGMRDNPGTDYETEFTKLTHLDERLCALCREPGVVKNTNDGPMAAFTAAVELAAGSDPEIVRQGVFAHTLGTELGTGWVTSSGTIPEIPLETYNLIIDLGASPEKEHPADDVRSVNNFNTGLRGSIQRFASQSGVFRLALKLLRGRREDLIQGFYDRGFLSATTIDGKPAIEVPVKPKDMRKPFLEHIMSLVESESDDCVKEIFREVGRALGVAWHETQYILEPECAERILFGRLVKRSECFRLISEGAKELCPDVAFTVADESLANTDLMEQLARHPDYTVAQFAQAIGAVYYAHLGILAGEIEAVQ